METLPITPPLANVARPAGVVVNTILLHATAGSSVDGAVATLRQRGLGYHYLVAKDGKVFKGCPASRKTSHAGESVGPQGRYCNRYSIGISFINLNDGKDPYTDAQYQSAITLCKALMEQFPTIRFLTTHAIVSPGRKTDPRGFLSEALAKGLGLEFWRP